MRQTILAIYISIVFHCVIWYPLKGAEWYHFQTNPHGDVQVVIHTLSQRDVNNKIAWGSDPSISLLTMMGISTRWAWRMIMGILQATHLRRARSRGLLLGRPPIQHSYQSSGLETPPSVNDRWIRWRDPKQLRRTFVDKTDKSLKQEPLRVVYGIPSAYNAIFSRSVCKRALQIIRQEPSRTSESFPKKITQEPRRRYLQPLHERPSQKKNVRIFPKGLHDLYDI